MLHILLAQDARVVFPVALQLNDTGFFRAGMENWANSDDIV